MSVGLIQSVEGLNSTKGQSSLEGERIPPALELLSCDIGFFLPSDLNWNSGSFWVLNLPAFQLKLCHWLSWVSSLLAHPKTCDLPGSRLVWVNYYKHLSVCMPTHTCISTSYWLFSWKTLTNTLGLRNY